MNTVTRYWTSYLVFRIKLWLAVARLFNRHYSLAGCGFAQSQAIVDSILLTYHGYDFAKNDGLYHDIPMVANMLNSERPYIRYARWRVESVVYT